MSERTIEPVSAEESKPVVTEIKIVKGNPTDEEVAALVTVLAGASGGGQVDEGPQIRNLWGHPVDKLRYATCSWERVTLVERTHLRR